MIITNFISPYKKIVFIDDFRTISIALLNISTLGTQSKILFSFIFTFYKKKTKNYRNYKNSNLNKNELTIDDVQPRRATAA